MLKIERLEKNDKNIEKFIDDGFEKHSVGENLNCSYTPFVFVAKEKGEVVGALTGNTIFTEVRIRDLIVHENYRGKGIGLQLMKNVEDYYKDKGFENLSLTTFEFQAPEFYKKCSFELEFTRENKENPKLTKYFFVKYF